ncbi:MAG TPA: hypothetical protein VMV57_14640 [Terracidiphilus sp.]|nr:hypothetical protein [Terracidiphilus sp.]
MLDLLARAEGFYCSLMQHASAATSAPGGAELGLGGRLVYAGELDALGRALVLAGNVAGTATLTATADATAQKQAIRDGVVDFLVTSLDEALRILKNEIRKCEPVAVCVGASAAAVEREMVARGVQPDLLAEVDGELRGAALVSPDARKIAAAPVMPEEAWLAWSVTEMTALWMPKLDAMALVCLSEQEQTARRWLRHAPRYGSRLARGVRVLRCRPQAAQAFVERVREAVSRGELGAPVWTSLRLGGELFAIEWKPLAVPENAG